LRIYSVDASKHVTQIFPNAFEPNDAVTKGQTLRVPGTADYDLQLELPPGMDHGSESIQAVLTPDTFLPPAVAPDSKNPFLELGQAEVGAVRARGLRPRQKTVEGEAQYTVKK
jgi:hypothetical protein